MRLLRVQEGEMGRLTAAQQLQALGHLASQAWKAFCGMVAWSSTRCRITWCGDLPGWPP